MKIAQIDLEIINHHDNAWNNNKADVGDEKNKEDFNNKWMNILNFKYEKFLGIAA